MNMELTALTRPRIESGVSSCTSMPRTNTLTMSPAPAMISAASDSQKLVDSPTMIMQTPNNATPPNIQVPACRWIGRMPSQTAHDGRADAGCGTQDSEADRADVEDLVRVRRQQRRRRRRTARRTDRARSRRAPASSARRTRTLRARRASAIRVTDLASTGFTPSISENRTDQQCDRDDRTTSRCRGSA